MKKPDLNITDDRMLQLPDILQRIGTIRFRQAFCDALEMHRQNITNIKNGTQHFTVDHISRACKKYDVNANWIFGFQDNVFNYEPLTKKITGETKYIENNRLKRRTS